MRAAMVVALIATLVSVVQPALAQKPERKPPTLLLVGASGMIGSRILAEATARGHYVIAAARHPEKITKGPNIHVVQLDASDEKAFSAVARQADVIVLATSPRGGGDPLKEARAVSDAAIATARAAHKRLLVVGGAGSLNLPDGRAVVDTLPPAYQGEARAMRAVLEQLKRTNDVDWTFFSPAFSISPGEHTGRYRLGTTVLLGDANGKSHISAEDFADALVKELEKPEHERAQMTIAY